MRRKAAVDEGSPVEEENVKSSLWVSEDDPSYRVFHPQRSVQ